MSYKAEIVISGFGALGPNGQMIVVRALLEALTVVNLQYLAHHPEMPSIYVVRPRYVTMHAHARGRRVEVWQDLAETFRRGEGNCKDFSCIRVAELKRQGFEDVVPYIKLASYLDPKGERPPLTLFHVLVRNGSSFEDPSKKLGMPRKLSYEDLRGEPDAAGISNARWGSETWALGAGRVATDREI